MSDMKCVKCNSDLERIGDFYACTNPHCTLCGDKNMWQELIRTRKALGIAVDALKKLSLGNVPSLPDDETLALAMCNYARDTLEQITAQEQKE